MRKINFSDNFTRPLFIVLHAFILLLNFRRRDVLNQKAGMKVKYCIPF